FAREPYFSPTASPVSLEMNGIVLPESSDRISLSRLPHRRDTAPTLQLHDHGLRRRVAVERFVALLPTVARLLETTERILDSATGAERIHVDLTGSHTQ